MRHDFLELLAEQTGGRPVVDSDDLEASVAGIFEEYGSYYLLGYETTNGEPDGKFRRLDVDVPGRDLDVQAEVGPLGAEQGQRDREQRSAARFGACSTAGISRRRRATFSSWV